MLRTFVAAEINNKELLDSIKKTQSELDLRAKPINPENMHFTLLFLGEISEQIAYKVQDSLNKIEFSEFNISFRGIGAFPKARAPRIVWMGTDEEGGKQLCDLAIQVQNALSPLGFHSDKPFRAHITIFRIKKQIGNISDKLERFSSKSFGVQKISEIKLKRSILTPEGPNYSDLQVIKAK